MIYLCPIVKWSNVQMTSKYLAVLMGGHFTNHLNIWPPFKWSDQSLSHDHPITGIVCKSLLFYPKWTLISLKPTNSNLPFCFQANIGARNATGSTTTWTTTSTIKSFINCRINLFQNNYRRHLNLPKFRILRVFRQKTVQN